MHDGARGGWRRPSVLQPTVAAPSTPSSASFGIPARVRQSTTFRALASQALCAGTESTRWVRADPAGQSRPGTVRTTAADRFNTGECAGHSRRLKPAERGRHRMDGDPPAIVMGANAAQRNALKSTLVRGDRFASSTPTHVVPVAEWTTRFHPGVRIDPRGVQDGSARRPFAERRYCFNTCFPVLLFLGTKKAGRSVHPIGPRQTAWESPLKRSSASLRGLWSARR
jgi:hypothetical protein